VSGKLASLLLLLLLLWGSLMLTLPVGNNCAEDSNLHSVDGVAAGISAVKPRQVNFLKAAAAG